MSKPGRDIALSDLQLAVVRVLWHRGECSVAEVAQALDATRGLKHTTVATILTRLRKRGVVSLRREGRQLMYCARVSEPQVRRSMVADLIGNLFGGDSRELVAHLVRESELAPGDLQRLQQRLRGDNDDA